MKLVVREPGSEALRDALARDPYQFTSTIAEVEVLRAVRRAVPRLVPEAQRVLAQLALVEAAEGIRRRAGLLDPVTLRSLDAVHLATALEAGDDLDALVTYDARLAGAAEAAGVRVLAPA